MEIKTYGNIGNKKLILIHGFESPWQIWEDYIKYYKKDFFVIVPIMPGHNLMQKEDFKSFDKCAKEVEEFCINNFGNEIFAVYGMSMGGVMASFLWKNKKLNIQKLILESSPLTSFGKIVTKVLTKQYLNMTHKVQNGDKKLLKQAVNSMVTEDKLNHFEQLLNNISDKTIINYLNEIEKFTFPINVDTTNTEIFYSYGGKISEFIFKNTAKYIKKHYKKAVITCYNGKGHCEDALIEPKKKIKELNGILKYNGELL